MNEIDFLYKLSELCEENDCRIEITQDRLVKFSHYGDIDNKPYVFERVYPIDVIEDIYKNLDGCAKAFTEDKEREIYRTIAYDTIVAALGGIPDDTD